MHYEDLIEELIGQEAKEQLAFEDTKKGFRPELSDKQITDVLASCQMCIRDRLYRAHFGK